MMRNRRFFLSLILLAICAPALAQQHYWHDGGVRRPLRMEANLEADFHRAGTGRAEDVLGTPRTHADRETKEVGAGRSPVFRDARGGPLRALPGGVIVSFPPGLGAEERARRLARHGLEAARSIEGRPEIVLVHSAAGMEALDLANRLHESGDFLSAVPNWWQARVLK